MSPMSDNRNLTGDKPFDPKGLENANQPARHQEVKDVIKRGSVPNANPEIASQNPVSSLGAQNTEVRPSLFSHRTFLKPAGQAAPLNEPLVEPKEAAAEENSKETAENKDTDKAAAEVVNKEEAKETKEESETQADKTVSPYIEQIVKQEEKKEESRKAADRQAGGMPGEAKSAAKTAPAAKKTQPEPEKIELPKTVFGDKAYIKKNVLKNSLWKDDSLRNMTKLGRNERSKLAQEFFPDRHFVRKGDVEEKIRKIEKGQIKPPKVLGEGRIGRTRAANVLRGMIGEKQKKIY